MAGLAHEAANFFKFLLILVLYTLAMTVYVSHLSNQAVLAAHARSPELSSRLPFPERWRRYPAQRPYSALSDDLCWLLCSSQRYPTSASLVAVALPAQVHARGALSQRGWLGPDDPRLARGCAGERVGELDHAFGMSVYVQSRVMISINKCMQLFGFGAHSYYRDVLVLVGFVLGFGAMVIGVVWLRVRERR
jgi:hypothetical protein